MIIGVPQEIKNNENRVGMTPAGVAELVKRGHQVYVQHEAGIHSGFADEDYTAVGARILPTIEEVYARAEMIVKVKEPIAPEYGLIRPGQVLFTYFHFAADRTLTEAMLQSGAICIAYETVEKKDRSLPLLIPMSEVAGRMSVQEGARFLEKPQGGKGILLGGVPGVRPARVLILGGGTVGTNAAWMAAGLGAEVTITDINLDRLRYLSEIMPKNVTTLYSSEHNIRTELPTTDLVIGSVLLLALMPSNTTGEPSLAVTSDQSISPFKRSNAARGVTFSTCAFGSEGSDGGINPCQPPSSSHTMLLSSPVNVYSLSYILSGIHVHAATPKTMHAKSAAAMQNLTALFIISSLSRVIVRFAALA